MWTVILLTITNVFMTFAWYGHLKHKSAPLWIAIVVSWLIAFLEYCFQVPANRIGSGRFSTAQLKIIQEVITLVVFSVFSVLYLREQFRWNYAVAFVLIVAAVAVVFYGKDESAPAPARGPLGARAQTVMPLPAPARAREPVGELTAPPLAPEISTRQS
jgi:uncharacterized protein (DUF486 family)